MTQVRHVILFALLALNTSVFSQTTYPKITGYFSVMHPIVTISNEETAVNFRDYYAVNFPTGINIWKSAKIGFSFEIAPTVVAFISLFLKNTSVGTDRTLYCSVNSGLSSMSTFSIVISGNSFISSSVLNNTLHGPHHVA